MKTILITGASRGLGKQLALHYAAPFHRLILIATQLNLLNNIAKQCQAKGASTITAALDVCNKQAMYSFIQSIDAQYPIDLIIANAGVASSLQPNWQQELSEDTEKTFNVNLHGTLNTIQPMISPMIQRQSGQIVIISSLAALLGLPQSPSYCASKAAIKVYGQSLRSWLHQYHIKVNVVIPGFIDTDMCHQLVSPKLFILSAEQAARIIVKGLDKNKAVITLPTILYRIIQCAKFLPSSLLDKILSKINVHIKPC